MKEIKLTQGKVALVDDEDYEEINKYKWCAHKGKNTFYAFRHIKTVDNQWTSVQMHREILKQSEHLLTDHKDSNGLNNRKSNLRACTDQENCRHSVKKRGICSSIFKGVTWHNQIQRWRAYIMSDYHQVSLGCYASETEAAHAYDVAAKDLFGEFALLNFNT